MVAWALMLSSDMWQTLTTDNKYFIAAIASSGLNKVWYAFVKDMGYTLIPLAGFYGNYFFTGPRLFISKKYWQAVAYFLLTLCTMVAIRYVVEFWVFVPYLRFHNYFWKTPEVGWYIWNCIVVSNKYCLFGLILYFIVNAYKLEKDKKEIEKEKVQAELSLLRSQINPHFLFNTINDIYALAYQKSDNAPIALLKLSSMLRYMLDASTTDWVPIEKELQYLDDYVELQTIGYKNEIYLDYSVTGNIAGKALPPLLLIPFVENIFKHGVINDCEKKGVLSIAIINNGLELKSRNYIKRQQKDATGGIGLKNVKRRLDLLYPNKHSFTATQTNDTFECALQIYFS